MSIGFPTGDWCCSPSFSKTTPNMFKGRLNRGERFPAHNRGAAYIWATRPPLFSARFMWEDGCWRVRQKKAALQTFPWLFDAPAASQSDVAAPTEDIFRKKKRQNLHTGSSIFMLRRKRIELGTVFSINWSIDCQKKKRKIRFWSIKSPQHCRVYKILAA